MALNKVLEKEEKGVKEGDKKAQITSSISSLRNYKERELSFIRANKLGVDSFSTLVLLVCEYSVINKSVTIYHILHLHCLGRGAYTLMYNRLERLYKRGLVECNKVYTESKGYVSYFRPTEKGLEGVLSLLD